GEPDVVDHGAEGSTPATNRRKDASGVLVSSEGRRPSDSPTPSLARRFAASLRSGGSFAALTRWCMCVGNVDAVGGQAGRLRDLFGARRHHHEKRSRRDELLRGGRRRPPHEGKPFSAYLHLSHQTGEKSARTVPSADGLLVVDYGQNEKAIGVEI